MRRLLLLTLIAACSPVVAHNSDASLDGTPDAPTHGTVRVKVYDPNNTGAIVTGVPVVFVEADDTQVGHPTTDSEGFASADVHAGASATVVITTQGSTQMTTLFGLKPGDDIILGQHTMQPTDAGSFNISWPQYPGASQYYVYGPCGQTNTNDFSAVLSMQSDCKQDPMTLLVVPVDANENPLGYLTKTGVAFVAGGSTAVTGTYQSVPNFTASYTNIPASATSINYRRYLPDLYGFYRGTSGTPSGGTYSTTVPAPPGPKAQVSTDISNDTGGSQEFIQVIDGSALTYGMDVGATALPWIGVASLDGANHKIVIPIDSAGTSGDMPDAFLAQTTYTRTVSGMPQHYAWVTLSATPGDVKLPTMPPEVGDVMPKLTDTPTGTLAIMVESDAIDGYDTVRQDIYSTLDAVTNAIHPMSGKLRESVNFNGAN